MAQFVEVLRYKSEGSGFDWDFSLTQSFRPHYGPSVDSASNRNKHLGGGGEEEDGRCVGLTALSPPRADFLANLTVPTCCSLYTDGTLCFY